MKNTLSTTLFVATILIVMLFFQYAEYLEHIDYFDFISDFIIVIFILIIVILLSKVKQPITPRNILIIGFIFLYISLLNDVLDELFITSTLVKNVMENFFQVLGFFTIFVGVFRWIEHNDAINQRLKELSEIDPLTGIMNRRSFLKRLSAEIERSKRYKSKLSIILIDLDYFKNINDKYGHNTGDEVLINLCSKISNHLRKNDAFCRWGGEEFMIFSPETDREAVKKLCDKIKLSISEHKLSENIETAITVSIGCTSYLDSDTSDTVFIERADKALYFSKNNGRNQVSFL